MMRKQTILVVFLALMLVGASVFAQSPYRDTPEYSTNDHLVKPMIENSGFDGLLDASRISMNHQMGMGYSSAGGNGYTQGYYMNTIRYRFDAPVDLQLRLGVANNPFKQAYSGPGQGPLNGLLNNAEFFGGADLSWRPADNVLFRISVDRLAPGMYRSPHYGNLFMGGWDGHSYESIRPWDLY